LSSAIGAEDVREYRAGMVVEADVVSIAEALSVFGNMSSEELADMGLRGNRLLKEKYNWESIAKRLREAYAS
jgi:glycosyltransferase involved in cell wall biosynthesis